MAYLVKKRDHVTDVPGGFWHKGFNVNLQSTFFSFDDSDDRTAQLWVRSLRVGYPCIHRESFNRLPSIHSHKFRDIRPKWKLLGLGVILSNMLENAYLKPSRDILAKVPPSLLHCAKACCQFSEFLLFTRKQPPWKGKKLGLHAKGAA